MAGEPRRRLDASTVEQYLHANRGPPRLVLRAAGVGFLLGAIPMGIAACLDDNTLDGLSGRDRMRSRAREHERDQIAAVAFGGIPGAFVGALGAMAFELARRKLRLRGIADSDVALLDDVVLSVGDIDDPVTPQRVQKVLSAAQSRRR